MFSWSKKADSKKRTKRRGGSGGPALNEFGLPVGPTSEGNDEELEAELRALTGGVINLEEDLELNDEGSDVEAEFMKLVGATKGKKKKAMKGGSAKVVDDSEANIDAGAADVDLGETGDDEDIEIDENDPELLGELMDLTGGDEEGEEEEDDESEESEEKEEPKKEVTVTSLLQERLNMYKMAEAKAKENNESSRARRFARGIKTLQQLIKKAEAGQPVLPSEIPPVIATNLKPAPPPAPAPPPSVPISEEAANGQTDDQLPAEGMENLTIGTGSDENTEKGNLQKDTPPPLAPEEPSAATAEVPAPVQDNPWLQMLRSRRDEYKSSALNAKRNNDLETALRHVKIVKQLDALIASVELGEEIDESDIPPSLSQPPSQRKVETLMPLRFEAPADDDIDIDDYETPRTVLEALNQRLRIYSRYRDKAEGNGDEAGVAKNSKIVQIYKEAIKLHTAGKKVPLHKLPTPAGCPPIPIPFEVD